MNATSWAATYLARVGDEFGMTFHCLWYLQLIENRIETLEDERCATMFGPAAATWFSIAGVKIRRFCKEGYKRTEPRARSSVDCGAWLWRGPTGFNLERWAFWKQRFEVIGEMTVLEERVRGFAIRAVKEMGRIEADERV